MNSPSRTLVLCADDYAQDALIDDAVLHLARAGRLSATSCMTTSPRWREAVAQLLPLRPALQLGLHFNLTESHGGHYPAHSLHQVLARAYTGRLGAAQMRPLWRAQLDAFEDAVGSAPDFIDGHQHVHQLPGVRHALLAELQARYRADQMPWLRSTVPAGSLWRDTKAAVIALLGGRAATRQWRRAGLQTNHGFAGVYGFDAPTLSAYAVHMRAWLAQLQDGGLLMCHPATAPVLQDAIGIQRPVEYAYLMSDAFGALLELGGWRIGALSRTVQS
ncbi:ChbG/HpnK family deacetylase [Comamonas faecalis]|uniref:ChbG/HpnK family deacetylase n=1 Tax=Comamonas faecalis TaxID=1387849 RepID=A0ABP7RLQ5_9BURK